MELLEPITAAIDEAEKLLGHSPHPAIVVVPLGAWTVSNVCDGLALLTGEKGYDDAARVSMAVGLVGAAGAVITGLRDYSFIPKGRASHQPATMHAIGNAVVTSLFVASYIARERDERMGRRPGLVTRLLGLSGGGLSLYTAWLGGVLVSEYGESVKPVMNQGQDQEAGKGRQAVRN